MQERQFNEAVCCEKMHLYISVLLLTVILSAYGNRNEALAEGASSAGTISTISTSLEAGTEVPQEEL
jgi:hypothetical protein